MHLLSLDIIIDYRTVKVNRISRQVQSSTLQRYKRKPRTYHPIVKFGDPQNGSKIMRVDKESEGIHKLDLPREDCTVLTRSVVPVSSLFGVGDGRESHEGRTTAFMSIWRYSRDYPFESTTTSSTTPPEWLHPRVTAGGSPLKYIRFWTSYVLQWVHISTRPVSISFAVPISGFTVSYIWQDLDFSGERPHFYRFVCHHIIKSGHRGDYQTRSTKKNPRDRTHTVLRLGVERGGERSTVVTEGGEGVQICWFL